MSARIRSAVGTSVTVCENAGSGVSPAGVTAAAAIIGSTFRASSRELARRP